MTLLMALAKTGLGIDRLNTVCEAARRQAGDESFARKVLRVMNVVYRVAEQDLQKIPGTGATIFVANHPFGMIEGLVLSDILAQIRPDTRILANYMLSRVEEMRRLFIFVNPFRGPHSMAANIRPMKECLRWLYGGGALGIFPSGEVSHWSWQKFRVQDPPWAENVARLIRRTQSVVVPVFFEGANGPLFQLAGLAHPILRTVMLPREFLNKKHAVLNVRIGTPVACDKLHRFDSDAALIEHLRLRTYILFHRGRVAFKSSGRSQPKTTRHEPLTEAVPANELAMEISALPLAQKLISANEYDVFFAHASQIPWLLREIGRLRELTFREAGEGSGHALDIDRFDKHYLHLFVWHTPKCRLVGAYRMGQADLIVAHAGIRGLYSNTLFKYQQRLINQINPALEMGRAFIRPEYQRAYTPLFLLWKGIGAYIARHPHYVGMFGPVSISNQPYSLAGQLLARLLKAHYCDARMAMMIKPRHPPPVAKVCYCDRLALQNTVKNTDDIADLIREIDPHWAGTPVLLKQYIKLGGRLLAFNLDPSFGNVLDGLIWVNLHSTDPATMLKYMGSEGYKRWRAHNHTN